MFKINKKVKKCSRGLDCAKCFPSVVLHRFQFVLKILLIKYIQYRHFVLLKDSIQTLYKKMYLKEYSLPISFSFCPENLTRIFS